MSPESLKWAGTAVRFLVNTEGCGYPPFVNCTLFALKYGYVGSKDITLFETINQPETRELYRHGNGTGTGTESPPALTAADTTAAPAADRHGGAHAAALAAMPTDVGPSRETVALKVFPCYYSRAYPDRVVAEYDWHHTIKTLVAAVVIPWTLFFVSCAVLCYWYCPALKKEFMIDRRKTAAVKNENPQLVIR